jgi:2-dehydro-3-deoxyphosphogluconate aldolase/(4S)-4-hydroxy-2-oxoglutarate aldolase
VIPVHHHRQAARAVPLARALLDGGVRVLEVTLRTPVALEAIRSIAAGQDAIVSVTGTISRPEDFRWPPRAGLASA